MRILLSGGGTLGPVAPLLAVYEEIQNRGIQADFLWVGTKKGPEAELIKSFSLPYRSIPAGKLRRYFSLKNFFDPIKIFFGFFASILIILKFRPSLVMSAGGYVSVPLVYAAFLLRVPVLIHQQDARVILANKLMAPCASRITATFPENVEYFGKKKCVLTGNPVRRGLKKMPKTEALKHFQFHDQLPILFVFGGGTGAKFINTLIFECVQDIVKVVQVIHITGRGKKEYDFTHPNYRVYEFLNEEMMASAYSAADLVVCRAGMSTLTELVFFQKPAVLIPLPHSVQMDNASAFGRRNAVEILNQEETDAATLLQTIQDLLSNKPLLKNMSKNISRVLPSHANEKMLQEIFRIVNKV